MKEQRRIDTFLRLTDQIFSQREQENRRIVRKLWIERINRGSPKETDIRQRFAEIMKKANKAEERGKLTLDEEQAIRQREAIEETIACFDKTGFFLLGSPPKLKVDSKLKKEAPDWLWSITSDMWNILDNYVKDVREGSVQRAVKAETEARADYGKYFEKLNNEEAKKKPLKSKKESHQL